MLFLSAILGAGLFAYFIQDQMVWNVSLERLVDELEVRLHDQLQEVERSLEIPR